MTIDLYYSLCSPPCRSVLLVAKALGVELNLKPLKEKENTTPEFLKVITVH
jgi:glutathione S-transferase